MQCWLILLLALAGSASAAQPAVLAQAGLYTYRIPGELFQWTPVLPLPDRSDGGFGLSLMWPDLSPVPPDRPDRMLGYRDGVVALTVQQLDGHPGERERVARYGPHGRFLGLWRDSTSDQYDLPALSLDGFTAQPELYGPGLLRQVPHAPDGLRAGVALYADAPLEAAGVLMTCDPESSCQLWWLQDETAVEVTFTYRLLPEWRRIKAAMSDLMRSLRVP